MPSDGLAIALGPGVTIELAHLRVVQNTPGMTRTTTR
jgi:predicted naringenin-chalcone synthase